MQTIKIALHTLEIIIQKLNWIKGNNNNTNTNINIMMNSSNHLNN